jgi:hypothetical protein
MESMVNRYHANDDDDKKIISKMNMGGDGECPASVCHAVNALEIAASASAICEAGGAIMRTTFTARPRLLHQG